MDNKRFHESIRTTGLNDFINDTREMLLEMEERALKMQGYDISGLSKEEKIKYIFRPERSPFTVD